VAVTRGTLQLARSLRRDIGTEVDDAVRTLAGDWVRAWDGLASAWQAAADELVIAAAGLARWPYPVEIMRMGRVDTAMRATIAALDKLADRTETVARDGADRIVQLDAEREPRIIASQAPAAEEPALARHAAVATEALREDARSDVQLTVSSRIRTDAVNVMAARAGQQIHAATLPLSVQAVDAVRRELTHGIDVGAHPNQAASRMVASVQGQFNGGLARAMNISRTELLDAYRTTSQQIHAANSDIVPGWEWLATHDRRVCPSCLSMDGTRHPVAEPGPADHQQGRCARLPVLASWAELGISAPEPPSVRPNAQEWFTRLPRDAQLQIMGPGRLQLLNDSAIGWGDLSTVRQSPGWRPSRIPTSLRDLQLLASRRAASA
jgi:SPP1 gp7 family putative phage head morphogenesis protein